MRIVLPRDASFTSARISPDAEALASTCESQQLAANRPAIREVQARIVLPHCTQLQQLWAQAAVAGGSVRRNSWRKSPGLGPSSPLVVL